ncbi:MAG TPA: autotransporter domain-containing protein [Steroidobacteraceae bacterium]|nr:autotransporter domain-containing protein [Steroidobacteraceae bacterium]
MNMHENTACRDTSHFVVALAGSIILCLSSPSGWAQQALPTADPGPARTVTDTDGLPGETVQLDGSGSRPSAPERTISSYLWTDAEGRQIASGPTPIVRLPDGTNPITLTVLEPQVETGLTLSDSATVSITVGASTGPVANAGSSRTVADTDGKPGEVVTLDGSASTDADGTIVLYEWFRDGNTPLGASDSPTLTEVALPDGVNNITLVVHDNSGNIGSATIVLTVGAVISPALEDTTLPPNERQTARYLDDLCPRLAREEQSGLTPEQRDLLARCDGLISVEDPAVRLTGLEQLGGEEVNAMRTQALVFSRTQSEAVMDRMLALRAGERGLSLSGLVLRFGNNHVPAEQVASSLTKLLGGGASADQEGSGDLLGNRLGLWLRGNYGTGDKEASAVDRGFDADQWGLTAGVDYRFSEATVAGVSLGFGESSVDFRPRGAGDMDTESFTGSLYGAAYVGNFYFDGVFNYAKADYDTNRHIAYTDGEMDVDRRAVGSTNGDTVSGGVAVGYDIVLGAFTISPAVGYFFVDTSIDAFAEKGASGLDLVYDEQNYESSTGDARLNMTYAWKTSWGVLIPHFRATFVREFEDATEVFGVRFAADPFANSADPTPPIIVRTNRPDQSYWRIAAGASAQLAYDISAYVDYQRLESFELVDFEDFTIGLRIQHDFR